MHVSGPAQFKPLLFKGQSYCERWICFQNRTVGIASGLGVECENEVNKIYLQMWNYQSSKMLVCCKT